MQQYECCAFILDTWVESVAQGRSNVPPVKLPWDLLRTLIAEMYGGKVDNEGDFDMLKTIVSQVIDAAAYETDHQLVQPRESDEGLKVPNGTTMPDFMAWVSRLPEREPPTYLGLPANAEKLLLVEQGQVMIGDLKRVVDLLEDDEEEADSPAVE